MLVNVERVYSYIPSKDFEKKSELPKTLSRCVCPQKNEQQQRKPVIEKNKKFRIKSEEKTSVVSRIGN